MTIATIVLISLVCVAIVVYLAERTHFHATTWRAKRSRTAAFEVAHEEYDDFHAQRHACIGCNERVCRCVAIVHGGHLHG